MSDLANISIILGSALGIIYSLMILFPGTLAGWARTFPRSRLWGIALAVGAMAWVEWLFVVVPMGQFEKMRPYLCVAGPVVLALMIIFMNELLAPRALGGLMLLIPVHLLEAARWHDSRWRLLIVVIAYIMVIKGMVLVLNPYMFRKTVERFLVGDRGIRLWGVAGLVLSGVLVTLGFTVF